jgi:hypothetical protein
MPVVNMGYAMESIWFQDNKVFNAIKGKLQSCGEVK